MSFITGVGLTSYGKHEGLSSLDLMSKAAALAISDAGLTRAEIDGILCGYSTVSPHIMLATVFAEHFGIGPSYAHAVQVGGATGLAMTMLAHHLVDAGVARHVLVVGGENRLTGQSRDVSIAALAQVGHPDYEVPLGPTIPAYYGLVASRYMHEYGLTEQDLAEFAVLMRARAATHPGTQFRDPITVADVMASKPVALPLKRLDCCPVSDGGAAFVISRGPTGEAPRARPRLRAGAHPPACHRSTNIKRTRHRDRDCKGEGRLRCSDIRCALCRGL
jgi:acetyl-CoA acetyltransferase